MKTIETFMDDVRNTMRTYGITDDSMIFREDTYIPYGITYTVLYLQDKLTELADNGDRRLLADTIKLINPNLDHLTVVDRVHFSDDISIINDTAVVNDVTNEITVLISVHTIRDHVRTWWYDIYDKSMDMAQLKYACMDLPNKYTKNYYVPIKSHNVFMRWMYKRLFKKLKIV